MAAVDGAPDTRFELADGRRIPGLGLGVFRLSPGATRTSVEAALAAGYRHVDTASSYGNEAAVGAALRASGVPREDVWITTKLWNDDHGGDAPRRALEASLERLGLDSVDLYLIHWPHPLRLETWATLERLRDEGLCASIGVSNFLAPHLDELLAHCSRPPVVDQIEMSPFLYRTRRDVVELCRSAGVRVTAYSPLTKGARLQDPVLARIARETGRTPAQVLIRWAIEHGFVVLPRSSEPDRVRENARVFDFALRPEQVSALDDLDEGLVTGWDPATTLS
jgi:diketogulonate reductase-like aldo/keto reductase